MKIAETMDALGRDIDDEVATKVADALVGALVRWTRQHPFKGD
jgi:hypothetical protein